jgi:hypothetical protein
MIEIRRGQYMAVEKRATGYTIDEVIEVTASGTTPVGLLSIQQNTTIQLVTIKIKTAGVRAAGALNLLVCDDDDADGYLAAADAKAAANTFKVATRWKGGLICMTPPKKGSFIKH